MLTELKFVSGAVARKDLIPGMTHFRIKGGRVTSYNGNLAMSSPIALNIDCIPKAGDLIDAISNCDDATTVTLTPGGRLSIRSGPFRALVPTLDGDTPAIEPAGVPVELDGAALVAAFTVLKPFMGIDASRPWTNGIFLSEGSAWATNNTCLIQYWLGKSLPRPVNIPRVAINEVLRIGEPPIGAQLDESSITFHYPDGRWIRSQLLDTDWPMERITEMLAQPCNPLPADPALFVGLEKLRKMADGANRVYLKDGALRTSLDPDEGSSYELPIPEGAVDRAEGLYNLQMLSLLDGVVTSLDLTLYPGPCLFFGDRIRGAIIGMRM